MPTIERRIPNFVSAYLLHLTVTQPRCSIVSNFFCCLPCVPTRKNAASTLARCSGHDPHSPLERTCTKEILKKCGWTTLSGQPTTTTKEIQRITFAANTNAACSRGSAEWQTHTDTAWRQASHYLRLRSLSNRTFADVPLCVGAFHHHGILPYF